MGDGRVTPPHEYAGRDRNYLPQNDLRSSTRSEHRILERQIVETLNSRAQALEAGRRDIELPSTMTGIPAGKAGKDAEDPRNKSLDGIVPHLACSVKPIAPRSCQPHLGKVNLSKDLLSGDLPISFENLLSKSQVTVRRDTVRNGS